MRKSQEGEIVPQLQNSWFDSKARDNCIDEDGYFKIYSGLQPLKKDFGLPSLNFHSFVDDEYIPVLNESDINSNRHRECHVLPKDFADFFQKTKIIIELETFDMKLFQGLDFDFVQKANHPKFNEQINTSQLSQIQHSQISQVSQKTQKQESSLFVFNEDYLGQNKQNQQSQMVQNQSFASLKHSSMNQSNTFLANYPRNQTKRQRKTYRGFYFSLQIKNTLFTYHLMNDLENPKNANVEFNRICFSIEQLIIKETMSRKGQVIRELLQLPYSYQYDNQIQVTISYDKYSDRDEVGFKLQIQPFKLMLNQATITFFQKFFDIDFQNKQNENFAELSAIKLSQTASQLSESQRLQPRPIYINNIRISPFQVMLSYTSHSLNIYDLKNGNFVEFLNIFNINDLKINVKKYDLEQKLLIEQALKHILQFYKDDLINNQKINFVKAIGPIRSLFNLSAAFYNLLRKPYQGYYSDKGFVKGLGEGVYGFYNTVTLESINFTNKIRDGVQKVKKAAEKRL